MPIKIPHSKPTIHPDDLCSVSAVLRSAYIAQGAKVHEFENKFARFQKSHSAVALNSGSAALHLALLALQVRKGDEVILPSFVCTALLNAVNYVGAKPKIVDVDYADGNISVGAVKKSITKKTRAIIVPHMFGKPADVRALLQFKIPIIEDCAQALGAKIGNKLVGSFGTVSIFSFYATKMLTTGEGGMALSNDVRIMDAIRDLRDYDNKKDYRVRFNYKMTDLQASLGISQFGHLPEMIKKRQGIAECYQQHLSGLDIELPSSEKKTDRVYFRYVIKTSQTAETLILKLKAKGIEAAMPVFKPLHTQMKASRCPDTDKLYKHAVSLPIYPSLTKNQIKRVIESLQTSL